MGPGFRSHLLVGQYYSDGDILPERDGQRA